MAASRDVDVLLTNLDGLRSRVLAGDNTCCFIERQQTLWEMKQLLSSLPEETRYATLLETLLQRVSTPITPEDVLLGRVVEGPRPADQEYLANLPGFHSAGHLTLDWPRLLQRGLAAIAEEAANAAGHRDDAEARRFADNAARCCRAVIAYAGRYAGAARAAAADAPEPRRSHLLRAATALEVVPGGPALDFFSALQSIWIVHLVISCYVGSRDFALGRMDQYLLPFYEGGLRDGTLTRDAARALLAHFLMKTKEITGTATDSYRAKPVPSFASNQYVVIGGRSADGRDEANEVSVLLLEAARLVRMPQPEINVRLDANTSRRLKQAVADALPVCHHQIQFWNDDRVVPALERFPIDAQDRHGYALTACNRINVPAKMDFRGGDVFHNMAHWLLVALGGGVDPVSGAVACDGMPPVAAVNGLDAPRGMLGRAASAGVIGGVRERALWMVGGESAFHFESVLLDQCVARGRDCSRGGLRYPAQFHFFGGVATVANSLMAVQRLVFDQQRYDLPGFLNIVTGNFEGQERLRQEIVHAIPKYGNDQEEVDALARTVCEVALDALDAAGNPEGYLLFPAIYSLYQHVGWGSRLPATPDGRLAGEPISENQSPVHGTDREGITALLRSVARLPLERTPTAGLNVLLSCNPQPEAVLSLVESFFRMGGVHVGFTFADRQTLLAAQAHPDQHRSLCVRVTGFSEYFVALSPEGQRDIIERTGY